MTDQRIKLAEFVGREACPNRGCDNAGSIAVQTGYDEWEQEQCEWCYCHPDSQFSFNPRNDANDCEALIRKLNEAGWTFYIKLEPEGHAIALWHRESPRHEWQGDDWKHGVCDLAEKVT